MILKAKKIISVIVALAILLTCLPFAFAATLPEFSVTFITNEGGYVARLSDWYQPGATVAIRAVPYDGFVFYSWEADGVVLESYSTELTRFVMPAQNVTIGVRFAVKQTEKNETLSVTYNTFGGTQFSESYVNVGECIVEPQNVPTKEGYVFEGWYSDALCTLPFNFSSPVYNATILYAKWGVANKEDVVSNVFSDVAQGSWYYEYITSLAERNYISGMGNGIFAPDANISRAQFATILANISGEVLTASENPFDDVSEDAWYAKAVSWAYSNGIVNGKSAKTFAPNDNISRQDMAVMIMRYVKNVALETLAEKNAQITFGDDSLIGSYAKEAVYVMQRAGIIGGKPGNVFDPRANATRAEASKMIFVLLDLIK